MKNPCAPDQDLESGESDDLSLARRSLAAVLSPEDLAEFEAALLSPTYDPALALDIF